MEGWIKTHRKIQEHWIYKEHRVFSKFEAWTDILLNVNHCEAKVFIKGTLFTVKRGDSINSLETWSKRWNWTKSKVRRFLELLQSDEMIVIKNEHKTTRLTVCNYDSYQDKRNADETQTKHRRNADETRVKPNKNEKNDNNDNNEKEIYRSFNHLVLLLDEFNAINKKYTKTEIDLMLDSIENYKGNKKYNSLNLTLQSWLRKEHGVRIEQEQPVKEESKFEKIY